MKACQAQATGSAGFNATKTQRHQETSMNITRHQTKAAFFRKTLGQCPSPNIIQETRQVAPICAAALAASSVDSSWCDAETG